jgi:UDP-N-acetylmuramoyl-tripeptide--D-alanyl-D-alanine ligase
MIDVVPFLRKLASHTWRRSRVPVVAITGSVGKTTTKELVADFLGSSYRVIRSPKNYNIKGLPSVLLDIPRTATLRKALARFPLIVWRGLFPPRPDYFVLEVGTTKPGDIAESLKMFTPTVSVITTFMPAHLDQLVSIEGVEREKSQLVRALPPAGHAVLRYDDERVRALARLHTGPTTTYGFDPSADVWMERPVRCGLGLNTVLHDAEGSVQLNCPQLSNEHHLYAVMAAWCVGRIARIPREVMKEVLLATTPQAGRGSLLTLPHGVLLMDETWNANPASMRSAFDTFRKVAHDRRRVVVLGDMLELGPESPRYHQEIGREAADFAEVLIAVGDQGEHYVKGFASIKRDGFFEKFTNVEQAEAAVLAYVSPDYAVLLKGSHGVHLSKLVKSIQNANGRS